MRPIPLSLRISLPSPLFLLSLWPKCDSFRICFAINASSEFVGAMYCKCRCIGNLCSPHNSRNYSPYPFSFPPVSPLPTIKTRTSRLGKWILTIIFHAANDYSLSFKILFEHGKGYHARSLNGTFSATLKRRHTSSRMCLATKMTLRNSLIISMITYSSASWTPEEMSRCLLYLQKPSAVLLMSAATATSRMPPILTRTGQPPLTIIIRKLRLPTFGHIWLKSTKSGPEYRLSMSKKPCHTINFSFRVVGPQSWVLRVTKVSRFLRYPQDTFFTFSMYK